MDDLYTDKVIGLAGNIARVGELDSPDITHRKTSKLCGSWIEIDMKLADGAVCDCAIRLEACAIGQAAASVLTGHIIGARPEEVIDARDALAGMLKGGPAPEGRFAELAHLQGVANYPQRHDSAMIAFSAAAEAMRTMAAETAA